MTSADLHHALQIRRWPMLIAVGLLGLAATVWVTREMSANAHERLEQRFQREAGERAQSIVGAFQAPLEQLALLQRLFDSVGEVDWPLFKKFVEPMTRQAGVRGFSWMPLVVAADREKFERAGRRLWGERFAIGERDGEGTFIPLAAPRERYFPALFTLPVEANASVIGIDLYTAANRGPVIDQAIDSGLPTASEAGHLLIDRQTWHGVVVAAPVYRYGNLPPTRAARRAAVRGVLFAILDVSELFAVVNAGAPRDGLRASLLGRNEIGEISRQVANPSGVDRPPAAAGLVYTQEVELARQHWLVRIEPAPGWLAANASSDLVYVPGVGVLLTLLLLLYLRTLLSRNDRAEAQVLERTADLAERQQAYATLVEHLPDIVCRCDEHSRYVFTNAAFASTLGLSSVGIVGHTVREVFEKYPDICPVLIGQWEAALREVLESGRELPLEFGFPKADGPRFFDGMLVREAATEKSTTTVLGIFREVTKRRAEEAWALKLSRAVEQSPASIVIADTEGVIEFVNDSCVETTGFMREQVLGQNPRIMQSGLTSPETYRALWATIKSGQIWRGELQNRRKNGELYWERVLIAPIEDAQGKITNFVAIKEDVSDLHAAVDRLYESEERFRGMVSVLVEGLVVLAADGRVLFANRSAEAFMGVPREGLLDVRFQTLPLERVHEDGRPFEAAAYPEAMALHERREVRDVVMGVRLSGGGLRWLLVNASPLGGGNTQAGNTAVLTFTEITARRRADEQLQLAFEAINNSGEGIMVTDAGQRILSVNPAFGVVTGYSPEEVLGQTPRLFASGRHDAEYYRKMHESLAQTGRWQGEIWNRRKSGEIYPEWLSISVVRQPDGRPKHYVAIFSDITERKEAQARIEFLAHHDPLTQLPNRLLLRDRVEQSLALAERMHARLALLFLDLDRFKTINDSLGHPVGDALLKATVERLRSCVRDSDTISRQGGDEFVIVLNDVRDSEAVARVADKIHESMNRPFLLEQHALSTSFSIGIALYPEDGEDFDTLLQKADTAMYHAKQAGRNAYRFFTEQMNAQAVEHLRLETRLRQALEHGEFVLHYQPQLDLHDERIVGAEALVRWVNPEEGLVPPAKFIPIAEESGLIVPIGAWVLKEACRQAGVWQAAGLPPFVVAVNLSAMQFRRQDLIDTVIEALALADLDAQWLELELTESILIHDAELTLETVRRLKAIGVKLSVDDFGTGYSSLAYLKRFAVDKLKIDQSFVRDLASDPDDAAIVRAIVQMAHNLKLKTIAEGVETEELADRLRLFHCDEAQGYWFAKPLPAAALEAFVRERANARAGKHPLR